MIKFFMTTMTCFLFSNILAMKASVDICNFKSESKNFVDVYLRVDGETLDFAEIDDLYAASVFAEVMIYPQGKNEPTSIERYLLHTSGQKDRVDLLDMRRFWLEAGKYDLHIKLIDNKDTSNQFVYKSAIEIGLSEYYKLCSQALILQKVEQGQGNTVMNRNGLYMEPLPYLKVGEQTKHIQLYQEIYTDFLQEEVIGYRIELVRDQVADSLFKDWPPMVIQKRMDRTNKVWAQLQKIDVTKLPTGRYWIKTGLIYKDKRVVETDKVNLVVKNKWADIQALQQYNSEVEFSFATSLDSSEVVYALKAIVPVVPQPQTETIDFVIHSAKLRAQKYYLLKHFEEKYPGLAEFGYRKYIEVAKVVDREYDGNVGHGFQTDRGFMFMKYGKPSRAIKVDDEPNTPPYEIWYYDYLSSTGQTNVRFIFYDRLQANDYELLHSTCYGERKNPAWEVQLYKFTPEDKIGQTLQATEVTPNWARRAKKLFNDF